MSDGGQAPPYSAANEKRHWRGVFVTGGGLAGEGGQQLPDDGDQRNQQRDGADDDRDGGAAVAFGKAVLQMQYFFAVPFDFAVEACHAVLHRTLGAFLCDGELALKGVEAAVDFNGIDVGDGKRDLLCRLWCGRHGSRGDVGRGSDAKFVVVNG